MLWLMHFFLVYRSTKYSTAPLRHHGNGQSRGQKHQQDQHHYPPGPDDDTVQPLIDGITAEAHQRGNLVGMVAIEVQPHQLLVGVG